ncbi:MAG: hypothetical protein ACRC7N_04210 [Clostridium sp.]
MKKNILQKLIANIKNKDKKTISKLMVVIGVSLILILCAGIVVTNVVSDGGADDSLEEVVKDDVETPKDEPVEEETPPTTEETKPPVEEEKKPEVEAPKPTEGASEKPEKPTPKPEVKPPVEPTKPPVKPEPEKPKPETPKPEPEKPTPPPVQTGLTPSEIEPKLPGLGLVYSEEDSGNGISVYIAKNIRVAINKNNRLTVTGYKLDETNKNIAKQILGWSLPTACNEILGIISGPFTNQTINRDGKSVKLRFDAPHYYSVEVSY